MWSYLTWWHVQFMVFLEKSMSDDDINDSSFQFNGYHIRRSKYHHIFPFFRRRRSFYFISNRIFIVEIEDVCLHIRCMYIFIFKREVGKFTTETCFHVNKRDEKSCKSSVSERCTIQEKNTLNRIWILLQGMWANLQYVTRIRFEIRVKTDPL